MADSRRWGFFGRLMVSSCMLVGGCRVRFLMRKLYCTFNRRSFGLKMIGMLHALSASCVFPLQLCASLFQTYDWLFSLMSANCIGLKPPAAMTGGWFLPVQAVSSAGLCNAFLEHHDGAFLLGAHWRRLLWMFQRQHLGKVLRDEVEHIWTCLGTIHRFHLEPNWTEDTPFGWNCADDNVAEIPLPYSVLLFLWRPNFC